MNELPVDPDMEFSQKSESSESDMDKVKDDEESGSDNESLQPEMDQNRTDQIDALIPDPELAEIQGTVTVIQKNQKQDALKSNQNQLKLEDIDA